MKTNTSLIDLNLSDTTLKGGHNFSPKTTIENKIGDEGGKTIRETMIENKTLKYLYLSRKKVEKLLLS